MVSKCGSERTKEPWSTQAKRSLVSVREGSFPHCYELHRRRLQVLQLTDWAWFFDKNNMNAALTEPELLSRHSVVTDIALCVCRRADMR